ncbi:uncharacterized protein LOC113518644 [Galleria mellonella]|uniref:Uncharacterized protein LOC113518644 n=1 Tax=Galleria mellonella TaxID=7137 RepID=A0ABM3MB03_GALME|nr:uncharacterized protein LOC113518644 [Galleria mellonella]XP_052748606.1 uncharacterized protein LOC113518644 [Galleria mellonella]
MHLLQYYWLATSLLTVFAAIDVEKTVKQVQNILQANAQLPRLSREEIIELLNNIRDEDAKSISSTERSQEIKTSHSFEENVTNISTQIPNINDNVINNENEFDISSPSILTTVAPTTSSEVITTAIESTTKKGEPTVMVVLPYTPRDGSSLQELYTRPPRVEVVPVSKVTSNPNKSSSLIKKLRDNNKTSQDYKEKKRDFPAELQAFLDEHGLKGTPGNDHFLLPLEGFKPLPPAKVVDGSVQLPENILLTYDLISSNSDQIPVIKNYDEYPLTPNYLKEPFYSGIPFELQTSSSENEKTVLPLDLPKNRKTKSTDNKPNYDPISYDSVKVIPLQQGINPLDSVIDKLNADSEPNKRQINASIEISNNETTKPIDASDKDIAVTTDAAQSMDSEAADTGASITDLEDSFGGAAPEKPGDSELPPPKKNGFYWMLDWNSFLEVGDGDTKVNIRFEPKLGDPQMFIPVNVP